MIIKRKKQVGTDRPRMIVRRQRGVDDGGISPLFSSGKRSLFESAIIVALVAMAVIAVGMSGSWVWNSSAFRVSKISVSGNEHVPAETVELLSELDGQRIFTADLAGAEQRIEQLAIVQEASVSRDWPNGISVAITERQPWGVWEQGGERYTIDRQGYVLGNVPAPEGSPVIRSDEQAPLEEGSRINFQAIDTAAALFEQLPERLHAGVAEISYNRADGVRVTTDDGQVAILGDSSGLDYKLDAWSAIASEATARGIGYSVIDLRYGNHPVLRAEGTP
jgi:cell division protein FtsQ